MALEGEFFLAGYWEIIIISIYFYVDSTNLLQYLDFPAGSVHPITIPNIQYSQGKDISNYEHWTYWI